MTIEEAKNILINRGFVEVNGYKIFDGNKWRNSIAIISKWLEQEPCGDCISREAMLSLQAKYAQDMSTTIFWQMRDNIRALPSVTPKEKTGWIPVSERLPEESKRYVVATKYNDVMTDFYTGEIFLQGDDIIAWMPLPEPYKPQENEVSE